MNFFVEKIMFDEIFCNDMVDRCKLLFKKNREKERARNNIHLA